MTSAGQPEAAPRQKRVVVAISLAGLIVAALVVWAVIAAVPTKSQPSSLVASSASPSLEPLSSASTPSPSALPAETSTPVEPGPTVAPPKKVDVPSDKAQVVAPMGDLASVTAGVTARVTGLTAVMGEARGPGDIAGPSVRFVLTVTNNTAAKIPLEGAAVNLFHGTDLTPSSSLPGPGVIPLPEDLAAGATATATLVYSVPPGDRALLTITLDYTVDTPLVVFAGPGPVV